MMQLRLYNAAADYPLFCEWWKKHGWTPPPAEILPFRGVVAELDGRPVACMWVYCDTAAAAALIEWAVADPANSPRVTVRALRKILDWLTGMLRREGMAHIIAATSVSGLLKLYERAGFIRGDTVTHLVYGGLQS